MARRAGTASGKYRVVSLFSGGMGLDLGLESTGRFEVVACVEKEPAFCETIRKNQAAGNLSRDLRVFQGDIRGFEPEELMREVGLKPGEVDLVVGGPPCQSFSTAGRRGTVQDARGTLLWDYLRFVKAMRPRFFLMENVRGLLSAALRHRPIAQRPDKGGPALGPDEMPGSVVRMFAEDLANDEGASYHMDCFEVNAVNYGAPQIRERVLFIGNRFGAQVDFPEPTHGHAGGARQLTLEDVPLKPWKTLREALAGLRDDGGDVMDFSPRKKLYLSLVPPGSNWRSLPENIQVESMGKAWHAKGGRSGWWRRLTYDLPCPTLVTMPNHASTSLCHPEETRALSVREYARIQEFPDNWSFAGTLSQKYAQVGNAVPVRLGAVAGSVIAESLDALRARRWRPYADGDSDYRVVYIQSHVRTRQWFKNGETLVWNDGEAEQVATYAKPKTVRKVRVLRRQS